MQESTDYFVSLQPLRACKYCNDGRLRIMGTPDYFIIIDSLDLWSLS